MSNALADLIGSYLSAEDLKNPKIRRILIMMMLANAIKRRPMSRNDVVTVGLKAGKPLGITLEEINDVLDSTLASILT